MNKLIFGKDTTEGIVNITLKDDKVFLYTEGLDGTVSLEKFDYAPWVLSAQKIKPYSERLKGDQHYKFLTSTTTEKFLLAQQSWNRDLWLPRSIEECFTLCEGATYFKNRKVADVSILSFDIETSGLAMDKTSTVFLITNTLRKKGELTRRLFSLEDYPDQKAMIKAWSDWVREVDPSIMTGHNILSYDLPYLANAYGNDMILGRDGSRIMFSEKTSKFRKDGSQQYEYNNARITGREIIDTFFLSIKYDIGREFPSYGLKPIINHLGLQKEDRTFIDASKISTYYKNRDTDPEMWGKVKAYATEDSDDSLKLYDMMIPAFFYLAQAIPKTFQQMINEASGSQLDSLMIRSYLQDGSSQPATSGKAAFEGAISMGVPGVYEYVAKADVASLYPSIMLEQNIHDSKKDPNNHMITMLTYFRDERLKNKKLAKETGDKYYDDMQNAQKIMINSMYGFLGSRFLLYNYPEGASAVTRNGREILLKSVEWATGHTLNKTVKEIVNEGTEDEEIKYEWTIGEKVGPGRGFSLVNVDTDSFSVTNGSVITKNMFAEQLKDLNSLYSNLIRWEDDGIYEKVIVLRAKNYVLVKDGKIKYKGSAMTDQKKEPALAEMLENMVKAMLANERSMLPTIYKSYVAEAVNIKNINRWLTKKTVTKAVLYGGETASQNVMKAIQESIDRGVVEGVQEGDKVWLYDAIDGIRQDTKKGEPVFYKDGSPKMIPNYILRDHRLWSGDEDKMHYVKRVFDTMKILENLVDKKDFLNYTLKSNQPLLKELDK